MNKKDGPVQLSLQVSLRDDATFANFYLSQGNTVMVHALRQMSANQGEQDIVIWGSGGCGLTHLLQACCHEADLSGISIQYLPLSDMLTYSPSGILDGMDAVDVVCLDGIDHICGNQEWEQGLFHFYNRMRDSGRRLLMASHISPPSLALQLPDLKSRVLGSVVYHTQKLGDDDKAAALQLRAKVRGMDMSDEVAKYILSRASRDMTQLFDLLNRLDEASLQQQRKLSIPFVKSLLTY